jgi:hypothetical protein
MAGKRGDFEKLLNFLEDAISAFPDIRKGKNTVYEIRDAVLSPFKQAFRDNVLLVFFFYKILPFCLTKKLCKPKKVKIIYSQYLE